MKQTLKQQLRNLFSNIKFLFITKPLFALVLTVVLCFFVAVVLFVIGGTLAGWDIVGILTSEKAVLLYIIGAFLALTVVALKFTTGG